MKKKIIIISAIAIAINLFSHHNYKVNLNKNQYISIDPKPNSIGIKNTYL